MRDIIEDVANEELKPYNIEGAFNGNFIRFRSEGIEEDKPLVTIEQYLQKTRRHVLKKWKDLIKSRDSWKVQLNVVALFRKVDGSEEAEKPIWSTPHMILEGTDFEEVIEEVYQKILGDCVVVFQFLEKKAKSLL